MNSQNDNGSLKQVALPADGGCKGGSDSRSETLSPREWPTLKAERVSYYDVAECFHRLGDDEQAKRYELIGRLSEIIDSHRRRRPRGESRRG